MDEERRERARREEEERKRKEEMRTRPSRSIPTKARPSSPPAPAPLKDRGRIRLGPTVSIRTYEVVDYGGGKARCDLLKHGEHFVAYSLEGAVAMTNNSKRPWSQYLRRVTHYSSLVLGTASNIALKDLDGADNEEWLRMYTHNFNTCVRSCNVFLSPDPLMIRMDMCNVTETPGEIPNLISKPASKAGTHIIERPLQVDANRGLCGALRSAPKVVITDLAYYTRLKARKRNIEPGLQNMLGNPDVKVFQVDWEILSSAESALAIFERALGHVTNVLRVGGQSPYVVVWLSFTGMARENSHCLRKRHSWTGPSGTPTGYNKRWEDQRWCCYSQMGNSMDQVRI